MTAHPCENAAFSQRFRYLHGRVNIIAFLISALTIREKVFAQRCSAQRCNAEMLPAPLTTTLFFLMQLIAFFTLYRTELAESAFRNAMNVILIDGHTVRSRTWPQQCSPLRCTVHIIGRRSPLCYRNAFSWDSLATVPLLANPCFPRKNCVFAWARDQLAVFQRSFSP